MELVDLIFFFFFFTLIDLIWTAHVLNSLGHIGVALYISLGLIWLTVP